MSGILALVSIAACDSSSEQPLAIPPPAPAPISAVTITIDDLAFSSLPTITPGAVVTVVNHDAVRHSVTSRRPGLFDEQVEAYRTITFTAPSEIGSHPFYCRYHAFMEGWLSIRQ
ncbi:plastocyanin [Nocardia sp. NPDC005366]|uniref:plastocyanin n=1 Tax=Nocardia sp. NPDC005366 TaxID=3156878 RepID=UPI0033BB38D0